MTTVVGDFVIDFSGLSAIDPYIHADITEIDGAAEIIVNSTHPEFVQKAISSPERFRYNGTVTNTTIKASIEIAQDNTYFAYGPALIAANGEGYVVTITYGIYITIYKITAAGVKTGLSTGEQESSAFTAGDRLHLELDTLTGAITIQVESDTPIFDFTDTSYDTGLAPAMFFENDSGGFGISSFGGLVGSATSSVTTTIINGTSLTGLEWLVLDSQDWSTASILDQGTGETTDASDILALDLSGGTNGQAVSVFAGNPLLANDGFGAANGNVVA